MPHGIIAIQWRYIMLPPLGDGGYFPFQNVATVARYRWHLLLGAECLNSIRTMAKLLNKSLLRWATKSMVWSLVASILLASLPIPIAVVSIDQDSGGPFPCQGGHCGCKTAFQCWTNCCCNTPEERVAWARDNRVAIPEYAQDLHRLVVDQTASAAKPACCQKCATKVAKAVVQPLSRPVSKPACCTVPKAELPKAELLIAESPIAESPKAESLAAAAPETQGNVPQVRQRMRIVLSMMALGCRGSAGELASLPWAIVPLSKPMAVSLGVLESTLCLTDVSGPTQFFQPELPPPRLS